MDDLTGAVDAACAKIDRQAEVIAELRAALETCADLLWSYGGDQSSDDGWKTEELREACLTARAVISTVEQQS